MSAPKSHAMAASRRNVEPSVKKKFYPTLFSIFGLRASFPKKIPGPYKTISSTHFRVPNGTLCQVFYPAKPVDGAKKKQYTRDEVLVGIASFAELSSSATLSTVSRKRHHVPDTLPVAEDIPSQSIIFSHGLCGSCDIYSLFCRDLASYGYTVWALEHEDHSAAYAATADGKPVYHVGPAPDMDITTKEGLVEFREEYLLKRTSEIDAMFDILGKPASELEPSVGPIVSKLCENADVAKVVMAGHSFGAASAILSVHQHPDRYTHCLAYDAWSHPVADEVLEAGLAIPTLSMLSSGFTHNDFTVDTRKLLANTPEKYSYWIRGIVHQSFSDSPFYLRYSSLAKKFGLMGETDRNLVQEIIIQTSQKFLKLTSPVDDLREERHKGVIEKFE